MANNRLKCPIVHFGDSRNQLECPKCHWWNAYLKHSYKNYGVPNESECASRGVVLCEKCNYQIKAKGKLVWSHEHNQSIWSFENDIDK